MWLLLSSQLIFSLRALGRVGAELGGLTRSIPAQQSRTAELTTSTSWKDMHFFFLPRRELA